jgi:hypothetical protein
MIRQYLHTISAIGMAVLFLIGACTGPTGEPGDPSTPASAAQSRDPVGARLDAFSFPAVDGRVLAWDFASGALRTPGGTIRPRCIALHVFQPDCNACQQQARALQKLHSEHSPEEMAVIGIIHRGDAAAAAAFAREFEITYPLAIATGSDWAHRWGRADPMYIVDTDGEIVYCQEGFQETDPPIWDAVREDIREGRAVAFKRPQRSGERLHEGDRLPSIELPDLLTGRSMALKIEGGRLTFLDPDGKRQGYRASIGFFSRY